MRIALRLLLGNLLFFAFFGAAILLQKSSLEKTAAYKTAEKSIRSHPELTLLLNRFPDFEETEMSLDLRNPSSLSMLETTVGKGKLRNKVRVDLSLAGKPLSWEVMKVEIIPSPSATELADYCFFVSSLRAEEALLPVGDGSCRPRIQDCFHIPSDAPSRLWHAGNR